MHDPGKFLGVKDIIKNNLKENMTKKEKTSIEDVIENMSTIFNDIDIEIELIKTYSKEEIENDEILDYVYGTDFKAFPNGMLLLKIKTKLKSNGVSSTKSIDETIALNIEYK